MSEMQPAPREEPIVIHGPLTGESGRATEEREDEASGTTVTVLDVVPTTIVATSREAPAAQPQRAQAAARVESVDAFRGILLLLMNFAYTIPLWGPFAGWMYHQQVPPAPLGANTDVAGYVDIAGVTWRDLLFPGFLFTMSAALPIVFGARLAKGMTYPHITWLAIKRAVLLFTMALIVGHTNPYWTQDFTWLGNVLALIGFVACFAFLVRPRSDWPPTQTQWLKRGAAVLVIAVLFALPAAYGQTFALERRDGILAAIAFLTVVGSVIWLFTRSNLTARLGILAVLLVARLGSSQVQWLSDVWNTTPARWLYEPWYLDLIAIVIAGTVIGDLVARWASVSRSERGWSRPRAAGLAALGFSVVPVLCVGLYVRRYPTATAAVIVAIAAGMLLLGARATSERDRVTARMYAWAALWLILGTIVEPLEGGIKKDPQTLGFILLATGSAIATLASIHLVTTSLTTRRRLLGPIVAIGQNPLLAYVVFTLGVSHLLWLSGYGEAFTATWPQALARSVLLTALCGGIVLYATRKRLLWRA